ncbi:hypothetical protein Ga0102493_111334 [Erythrobacter litoralis]|uniref:Periplasmic protein-like n=1 Tax=Erythrobacter litoralis TaxID=39960 RepID=A0A074M8D2_9SPHN|nr:hypothetical protein [Erythrobacter litoralis]AOL22361.1 hypothetical protein Ga0102493_111334 [Erythrobacter litoralis]KEO89649.1 hypothetical protein EH32_03865 [Erythrobacter litoralis]
MKLIAILALFASLLCAPAHALEYSVGNTGGNCSECVWIAAEGDIEEGDTAKLEAFLQREGWERPYLVRINSPGGNVAEALELGRYLRIQRSRVIVSSTQSEFYEPAGKVLQSYGGGVCASACVFVLMGGVSREISTDSMVGVHQFTPSLDGMESSSATISSTQTTVAVLQAYAIEMDIDPIVLTLAAATPPEGMLWLEPRDMERMNLLTSRNFKEFSTWALQPAGNQLVARASQEQTNGRTAYLAADCRFFHLGLEMTGDGLEELAEAIRGADLTLDETQWSYPLKIADVTIRDGMIVLSFTEGPKILAAIVQANDQLNIDIDVPWVYMSSIGGPQFDIPTSNMDEIAPHVLNSCR